MSSLPLSPRPIGRPIGRPIARPIAARPLLFAPSALLAALLVTVVACSPSAETARETDGREAREIEAQGLEARAPEVIAPEGSRLEGLPFSPGIRAGDFIYLSGSIGVRPGTTELISDDVGEQTRQTLDNLASVLSAAGSGLEDVVKCTVFLVDMADYAAMNRVYATVWPAAPPARSTMAGTGLALGAKVEIECIAYAPPEPMES